MRVHTSRAVRALRRRPLFAGVAVTTVALALGGNTAMFAVPSYPQYRDWERGAEAFSGLAFARGAPLTYRSAEHTGILLGAFVTESFFEVLGRQGRGGDGPGLAPLARSRPGRDRLGDPARRSRVHRRGLLFEVDPLGVTAYLAAAVTLVALLTLAAYVPARQAARLHPSEVLTSE